MNKLIAIGGVPATGKTTLMFELIKLTDDWKIVKPQKLLDAMYSEKLNLYVLGKYENDGNIFQGTDRLSMAVQPDAEKFINELNGNVIFEGDRLFNQKFLEHCVDKTDAKILILVADKKIVEQRHVDRKDNQNDKFKNGRDTKVSNIAGSLMLFDYIHMMKNQNFDDQKMVMTVIKDFLKIN